MFKRIQGGPSTRTTAAILVFWFFSYSVTSSSISETMLVTRERSVSLTTFHQEQGHFTSSTCPSSTSVWGFNDRKSSQTVKADHRRYLTQIRGGAVAPRVAAPRVVSPSNGSKMLVVKKQKTGGHTLKLTTKSAVIFGMLLAFNSGYINGICLSGLLSADNTKQASAAVTGAWTNSALAFAAGQKDQSVFNIDCILSYFGGSAIAGILNPNPVPFELSSNSAGAAFGIGAALMYASSKLASADKGSKTMTFLYLAAIANGIQNSITSTTTANLCRTTHFSGITSDMGTFLGQALRGNVENVMKLKVFAALALAFWVGGVSSYSVTKEYKSLGLMFSSALYLVIALLIATASEGFSV